MKVTGGFARALGALFSFWIPAGVGAYSASVRVRLRQDVRVRRLAESRTYIKRQIFDRLVVSLISLFSLLWYW